MDNDLTFIVCFFFLCVFGDVPCLDWQFSLTRRLGNSNLQCRCFITPEAIIVYISSRCTHRPWGVWR
jgi:hypothetical protein